MKKRIFFASLAVLILIAWGANFASANWGGTEDFESYTAGNDLNGGNGGTGWNGAWNACNVAYDVGNTVVYAGSNGVQLVNPGDNLKCQRSTTGDTSTGIFSIALYITAKPSSGSFAVQVNEDANQGIRIEMQPTDLIMAGGDTNRTIVSNYSVNTWYQVCIQYDTASTGAFQSKLCSEQNYSAAVTEVNAINGVNNVTFASNGAGLGSSIIYIDAIAPQAQAATATQNNSSVGFFELLMYVLPVKIYA